MDSQFAALSLDEETALRQIARGIRSPMAFNSQVTRLQRLGLVAQTQPLQPGDLAVEGHRASYTAGDLTQGRLFIQT